ncbi:MAG: hypothetical protein OEZ02_10595 [Anaerolineae bacterium]|nr:hypothetical protein [Anaerolineae bacterium]
MTPPEKIAQIRQIISPAYVGSGIFGLRDPARPLPPGLQRGEDSHLAYLTLVYAISWGREPQQLWQSAAQTHASDPEIFNLKFLAYANPKDLITRLSTFKLIKKIKTDATVWQRTGQAVVMRASGSLSTLLVDHNYDAAALQTMLQKNKATFPVLSGKQTAPRWLHGLATAGAQPIIGSANMPVPPSPAAQKAMQSLHLNGSTLPADLFAPLDQLGAIGCKPNQRGTSTCKAHLQCPVSIHCQFSPQ